MVDNLVHRPNRLICRRNARLFAQGYTPLGVHITLELPIEDDAMLKAGVRERLVAVILGAFKPPVTHHVIGADYTLSVRIYWFLKDDPSRKRKQSRNIYIHLSEDCLDDYSSGPESSRRQIEKKLVAFLRENSLTLTRRMTRRNMLAHQERIGLLNPVTNCQRRAAAILRPLVVIAGIAFVLFFAFGARSVVADVSNKIPIMIVSTCRDEVGKEIVRRIQDAVSRNVAIFNDGTRQIHLREASPVESRIVMEFRSKVTDSLDSRIKCNTF